MTDLAREHAAGSGRATARAALAGALAGIALSGAERRFLARISHWDKRSACMVACLISLARQGGRREAGLSGRRRDVVLAALMDACAYRTSGAAAAADCWECAARSSGLCAEHARDAGRAREFADLAAELSDGISQDALASLRAELRERSPAVTAAGAGG